MEDIDMCNLISNLLDNAIEAVIKLPEEQRKIDVKMGEKKGYFIVKCQNPFNGEYINYNKGYFASTKENKKDHGYGIKIIREITEKYDGEFLIESSNNLFNATALLKINNN
jgi:sensor histidine kinase regulating citrate/malate metabolism